MRTSDEWIDILIEHSIVYVTCFNGQECDPRHCINDEGNWVHKDDIEEYINQFIGMSETELNKLKTKLYGHEIRE